MITSIEVILRFLDYFFVKWHTEHAQEERDDLEAHPSNWFSHHFDGMPGSIPEDTSDKTNP